MSAEYKVTIEAEIDCPGTEGKDQLTAAEVVKILRGSRYAVCTADRPRARTASMHIHKVQLTSVEEET